MPFPPDMERKIKMKKDSNIQIFQSEREMLEVFITRLYKTDPDLLVAHNLCGSIIEILLARIQYLKINHWSRIGRVKRTQIPNKKFDTSGFGGNQWIPRVVSCGRLLVDTFLTAKELIRETSYDLTHLARAQLKKDRVEFDDEMITTFYQKTDELIRLSDHTERDAYLTF